MQNLKGTKTEEILRSAFDAEARAMTKYTMFAHKARQNGYNEISDIFEEIANNERAHAELWYKYLHDNAMPDTACNLGDAVNGEEYEWSNMYPDYAKAAREEGFEQIAVLFEKVADIEKSHEQRFRGLLGDVEQGLVFSKDGKRIWICMNCGNVVVGNAAPLTCPVCQEPQAYFKIKAN